MNVTVDPREIVCGFGEYAVVVSPLDPATIEIDGPPGDPDEGVVTVALSPPHAAVTDIRRTANTRRQAMQNFLRRWCVQSRCRDARVDLLCTRAKRAQRSFGSRNS